MRRPFFAPEVIQTSMMDCGPASLKSLLEGLGVRVSYGRLREACQTEVDGTSIDALEDLAQRFGLDARQVMLPVDQLMLADPFPALLLTSDPAGALHFVVAWRRMGDLVQLMDPGRGRIWIGLPALRKLAFVHRTPMPATTWRAWAESEEFHEALRARLVRLRAQTMGARLTDLAQRDPTWRSFAALDAALRMTLSLVSERAIERGAAAASLCASLFERAREWLDSPGASDVAQSVIPSAYWSVTPMPVADEGIEHVMVAGAVLVRIFGEHADRAALSALPSELEAAVRERPARPLRQLGSMLRKDGVFAPAVLVASAAAASVGGAFEAVLLRGVIDIGRYLGVIEQRLAGLGLLVILFIILLVLDLTFAKGVLRMGARLETRLRVAFLSKIPRLHDRYFQSRPTSDMVHRCHAIHPVREVPLLGGRLLRSGMDLCVAAAGLLWVHPRGWPLVGLLVVASTAVPWLAQRAMSERDLRVRSFDGALSRYYLDALQGLIPVRAHGAERALRREHGRTALEWTRAAFDRLRAAVVIDAILQLAGSGLGVLLVFTYLAHSPEPVAMLLLVYWVLNVPVLGQEIARTALLYPSMRNRLLRLTEPLGALEDDDTPVSPTGESWRDVVPLSGGPGMQIELHDVSIRAAGHTILHNVDLAIAKGSHVAIAGPSGAGKSSLVGLLLGWHRPAAGEVLVDGVPLRGEHRTRIRAETAWVDPSVHLWNRSMLENLEYGASVDTNGRVGTILEDAALLDLVERLPNGLQTELGEGGTLVSGGEGQRVRLGRGMMRANSRLVILDEAFRGLAREHRQKLLARGRARWQGATLLCITHDILDTRSFDRVLVVEDGRVVEDGAPDELLARETSRYAAMFRTAQDVQHALWNGCSWRRVTIQDGRLSEADFAPREEVGG
ncbi:ATP-binding cassette domain-containing protein [Pendulispora albinea]|uniref:ATP-binding cassette domain-containing protein n=1 Tax=Pendulispora albinea TaxID=2741071 RepID=A0ABZ2LLR1_9BACT